jgi:hypothetical protein
MKTTIVLMALMFVLPARADDEAPNHAYVRSTQSGRYFFKMVPGAKSYYRHDEGTGICYSVGRDGKDREIWRITGWYAFKTYLTDDGRYLVRLGNWPRERQPTDKDLGIAFYDRGKLLKRYSTKDLIKDKSKVQPSVSHYQYRKKVIGFDKPNKRFGLVTVDDVTWSFDVRTGKVLSKK